MAEKRKNPFCEEIPRQLKVHVGPKQVAGVEEMKAVHDYTKFLLFKGSNPQASNEVLQSVGCTNGFTNNKVTPINSKENMAPKCHECGIVSSAIVKCTDCERTLCSQRCIRYCTNCTRHYCSFCSVLNYDLPDVRAFCLECLSMYSRS